MVTENNSQINSFSSGIDSDTSIDQVKDSSYIYARNVRFIQYGEGNRNGSIIPIFGIKTAGQLSGEKVYRVLAAGAIREYGVIIYISHKTTYELCVAVFKNGMGGGTDTSSWFNTVDPKVIFRSELIDWPSDKRKWPKAVSISFKYEDYNNIKLYIATKFNPILVLNITKDYKDYKDYTIDDISSYPKILFNKPRFKKYLTGALKPGLISYAYQLYNDYGVATDISPACQQIPVINTNKPQDSDILQMSGENYGKTTSCGIQIEINGLKKINFDRIKIYRILTQQNGQLPTIEIIYDSTFEKTTQFLFNDVGQQALDQITIEEYNSMSGVHIIPNVIESKDQMLFAANVTEKQTFLDTNDFINWDARSFRCNKLGQFVLQDLNTNDTRAFANYTDIINSDYKICKDSFNPYNDINKQFVYNDNEYCVYDSDGYFGGDGPNVSWRFVLTYIPIDTCELDNAALPIGTQHNILQCRSNIETPKCYFIHKDYGLRESNSNVSNEDGRIRESWLTKSLRRNELYRYGIILYDKTGNPSPTKWIADIRTPNLYDKYFNTFISHYKSSNGKTYDLASLPLGVSFNIKNLPTGCTGYEIVRCVRREQDIATVSQGVISKPIVNYITPASPRVKSSLYFPTGLLTTAMVAQGTDFRYFINQNYNPGTNFEDLAKLASTNYANTSILQFVSPEVVYQPESMKNVFKNKDYRVEQLRYLFGSSGDSINGGYKYFTNVGRNLTRNYLRPAISNANLFTMPDDWKYYYLDNKGHVSVKKFISDPYSLKMETQIVPSIYYRATPPTYTISTTGALGFITVLKVISLQDKWSYVKPGKTSNPIYCKNKSHIDNKVFSYIKLYEQADNLLTVKVDQNDTFIQNQFDDNSINERSHRALINNLEIATDLQWNDVIRMTYEAKDSNSSTTGGGRWWPHLEYQQHIDSVGQYQFCNAVIYGTDGAQIDKGGKIGDDRWSIAHDMVDGANDPDMSIGHDYPTIESFGHTLCFPFSSGGRCAIMQVDEKDYNKKDFLLTNILGAKSYFKNNGNNVLTSTKEQCTYKNVNIESIAGTSLCNIRKNVTPYNGFSKESISSCVYYSTGQYFTTTNTWNAVFDGDVVISVLDYTSMHKAICNFLKDNDASKYKDIADYRSRSMMLGYAIPVESPINCRLSSGMEFSKNSLGDGFSMIQTQPSNIDGLYSQTDPEYVYNTAYSSENKSRIHIAFDTSNLKDFNKAVDYRCRNSNLKENNEHIDQWTKFQSSNCIDVDTQYGQITGLRNFKSSLIFWQQKALGQLSVNERAVATDQNDQSIILGTGGILSRYDYIDTTSGMHEGQFCDTQSDSTLYWFDQHNNELRCYNGQTMISLSKKFNVQNLINNEFDREQAPKLFFDPSYNEIVSKVLFNDRSIAFNENVNAFTSVYTIDFNDAIQFSNGEYLVKSIDDDLVIGQWNSYNEYTSTWGGIIEDVYIKYAINKNPLTVKVFDNQEFVTPQDECNIQKSQYIDSESYFSKNHQYTWDTESQHANSTLKNQITLREHNYRYSIPRQNSSNIYGSRMRGKYLICNIIDYKPRTDVALQYIITKFRTSWT